MAKVGRHVVRMEKRELCLGVLNVSYLNGALAVNYLERAQCIGQDGSGWITCKECDVRGLGLQGTWKKRATDTVVSELVS